MNSRVYVVQATQRRVGDEWVEVHDLSPAKQYGELVYVVPSGTKAWAPISQIPNIREKLEDFNAETDYLLLIGAPLFMAMVFHIAAEITFQSMREGENRFLRVLSWMRTAGDYQPITIPVGELYWDYND